MIDNPTLRVLRITLLCRLVQNRLGIGRRELGKLLHRHPDRLIPEKGNPPLVYLLRLSELLDWSVESVVEFISRDDPLDQRDVQPVEGHNFDALQVASHEAHHAGEYDRAITLGRQAYAVAQTPDERAIACIREATGHDGKGQYTRFLEVIRRGLGEKRISGELRRQLEVNLGIAHYTLWSLVEAEAISKRLIDWYCRNPPTARKDRQTLAFALYTYGNSLRRMMMRESESSQEYGKRAEPVLKKSRQLFLQIAKEFKLNWCAGVGNTIAGALLQVEVTLGKRDPLDALEKIDQSLTAVVDPSSDSLVGDWLESYAWWCIFGGYIALEYLSDERLRQRYMAVFIGKADDIAKRLDNWAIRERVLTMEYEQCSRSEGTTGLMFGAEVLGMVGGVMIRIPYFREIGFRLFNLHESTMRLAG